MLSKSWMHTEKFALLLKAQSWTEGCGSAPDIVSDRVDQGAKIHWMSPTKCWDQVYVTAARTKFWFYFLSECPPELQESSLTSLKFLEDSKSTFIQKAFTGHLACSRYSSKVLEIWWKSKIIKATQLVLNYQMKSQLVRLQEINQSPYWHLL